MRKLMKNKVFIVVVFLLAVALVCGLFAGLRPDDNSGSSGSTSTPSTSTPEDTFTPSDTCDHPADALEIKYTSLGDDGHIWDGKCTKCGQTSEGKTGIKHQYVRQTGKDENGATTTLSVCSLCNWTCSHKGEKSVTYTDPDNTHHTVYTVCAACNLVVDQSKVEHTATVIAGTAASLGDSYHNVQHSCSVCNHTWYDTEAHNCVDGVCQSCSWQCPKHDYSTESIDGYYTCKLCNAKKCAHDDTTPTSYTNLNIEQHTSHYTCDNCGVATNSTPENHAGYSTLGTGIDDHRHEMTYVCRFCKYTWATIEQHTYDATGFCDGCRWQCQHSNGYSGDDANGYYCYICGAPAPKLN